MKHNGSSGFTLLEMMTVMTVLAVLLAIGASSFREHRKRTLLRTTIEAIDADLRQARWIARTTGSVCYVAFDTENRTYTINGTKFTKMPDGIRFGVDPTVTSRPNQSSALPPADGISFDFGSSRNLARFYPTGVVAPTGTVFLTNGKETMAVTVAITGRPKMWRSGGGRKWVPL